MGALRRLMLLSFAALGAGCVSAPPSHSIQAIYINPVFNQDFPDPALLRVDGWIYAYATQGHDGAKTLNIQVARSRDLVHWEGHGDALPEKPGWAQKKQNIWAPHVIHDKKSAKFLMYYSAEPDSAKGKCLAIAVSESAAGPFIDKGEPLICGRGIEHIDPMVFDDPVSGQRLMYWGSGRMPIRVQELREDGMGFMPGSEPKDVLAADENIKHSWLIEGAWVILRNGNYYLFHSGDRCCEKNPSYALMVARSKSPFGPFERFPGGAILEANAAWIAPGHNALIVDGAGNDWVVYHAVEAKESAMRAMRGEMEWAPRVMLIDRIVWREGWPRVEGNGPSFQSQPMPAPARGN